MKLVDRRLIAEMLEQAAASPRRRAHLNFHDSLDAPIHRLLIGALPETDFPVHRHPDKWELFTVLHGSVEATVYDDSGAVTLRTTVAPDGDASALELPAGTWHTFRVLTPAVILEVKPGPYTPITPENTADFPR